MKWEPPAAMILLLALGFWVVWGPSVKYPLRPNATTSPIVLGGMKGELELASDPATQQSTWRLLWQDGTIVGPFTTAEFEARFGSGPLKTALETTGNTFFRMLNTNSWFGVCCVLVGLGGQLAFSGRWLIQWWQSEKRRESFVPASFWWASLIGGVILFAYFAWRKDIVGVLGQTSGVVVYARNIRLINKKARRDARDAAKGDKAEKGLRQADSAPGDEADGPAGGASV